MQVSWKNALTVGFITVGMATFAPTLLAQTRSIPPKFGASEKRGAAPEVFGQSADPAEGPSPPPRTRRRLHPSAPPANFVSPLVDLKNIKSLEDIRKQYHADVQNNADSPAFQPKMAGGMGSMGGPGGVMGNPQRTPPDVHAVILLYAKYELDKLRTRLRAAKSVSDSKTLDAEKQNIDRVLTYYFITDMKSRVAELDKIKTRVSALLAQLDRRMKAKDAVIELQRKVLLGEAEGLGFFTDDSNLNKDVSLPPIVRNSGEGSDQRGMNPDDPNRHAEAMTDIIEKAARSAATLDDLRKLDQPREDVTVVRKIPGTHGTFVVHYAGYPVSVIPKVSDAKASLDQLRARMRPVKGSPFGVDWTKEKPAIDRALMIYFIADMRFRMGELHFIEVRLKTLEAQLERRMRMKDEIIDLQKQVLLNEAEGLGFFTPETAAREAALPASAGVIPGG